MYQKRFILFFCMIFVEITAFSQFSPKKPLYISTVSNAGFPMDKGVSGNILPHCFYLSQLGFFCKKEWKFESTTKIPLRFRIGSVQYCDWLEGKKNVILPPGIH
jgi:hypothetical protein